MRTGPRHHHPISDMVCTVICLSRVRRAEKSPLLLSHCYHLACQRFAVRGSSQQRENSERAVQRFARRSTETAVPFHASLQRVAPVRSVGLASGDGSILPPFPDHLQLQAESFRSPRAVEGSEDSSSSRARWVVRAVKAGKEGVAVRHEGFKRLWHSHHGERT